MSTLSRDQREQLVAAIRTHDFLGRIVESLEHYHRLVFHSDENVDWTLVRQSAEQILEAEIMTRHNGDFDGIYHALRELEHSGKPWHVAIQELAGRMHSYFTTPLGVMIRADLFGDDVALISPEALEWIRRRGVARTATSGAAS